MQNLFLVFCGASSHYNRFKRQKRTYKTSRVGNANARPPRAI